jgi:hypothetical protein
MTYIKMDVERRGHSSGGNVPGYKVAPLARQIGGMEIKHHAFHTDNEMKWRGFGRAISGGGG